MVMLMMMVVFQNDSVSCYCYCGGIHPGSLQQKYVFRLVQYYFQVVFDAPADSVAVAAAAAAAAVGTADAFVVVIQVVSRRLLLGGFVAFGSPSVPLPVVKCNLDFLTTMPFCGGQAILNKHVSFVRILPVELPLLLAASELDGGDDGDVQYHMEN